MFHCSPELKAVQISEAIRVEENTVSNRRAGSKGGDEGSGSISAVQVRFLV